MDPPASRLQMSACTLRLWLLTGMLVVRAFAQGTPTPYYFSRLPGPTGSDVPYNRPWGIAVDGSGNVYVSEAVNHSIRKTTPAGVVTTFAGQPGTVGVVNAQGTDARFATTGPGENGPTAALPTGPFGLAVDRSGTIYVADGNTHTLRRISPTGFVTQFSGTANTAGSIDGPVASARFRLPTGIAVHSDGTVFVADAFNHVIRRITPAGQVTTIAGVVGRGGTIDGVGSSAQFTHPIAIAVSPTGVVFVAESSNVIRRLVPASGDAWSVTTIAGVPYTFGTTDGTGTAARFGSPFYAAPSTVLFSTFYPTVSTWFGGSSYNLGDLPGIAADAAGNVYVTDSGNHTIRKISPAGVVTTIGGMPGVGGNSNGIGSAARFARPCGIAIDAAGTLYITDLFGSGVRKGELTAAPAIQAQPENRTVTVGSTATLTVRATAVPPATYQWLKDNQVISGATSATLAIANVQLSVAGSYRVRVMNDLGTIESVAAVLTVHQPPLVITPPVNRTVDAGETVTFRVSVVGVPAPSLQWLRNGVPIAGATDATLIFANAQAVNIGEYAVRLSNPAGTVTSTVMQLYVRTGRLVNLSIRSSLAGSQPLIVGFVARGGAKPVLVRAVGPALRAFGVAAAMADPQLSLHTPTSVAATNDNWSASAAVGQLTVATEQVGAFALPGGSLDAALLASAELPMTAQASAANGAGGVVLVEVYDTASTAASRLTNISARTNVGLGENALFAGFVITGNSRKTLLLRAVGPSLASFGVTGALADPLLDVLTPDNRLFATNDNWSGTNTLALAFTAVGAFPFISHGSRDAAVVVSLDPGSYSARISGVGNTTGEALLEIYELP